MRKLFFDQCILLEYFVQNKLDGQSLKDVHVDVVADSELLKNMQTIIINELKPNVSGSIFVTLAKHPDYKIVTTKLTSYLKFNVVEYAGDGKTIAT